MTSSLNEVGISPVLLQAISQSLATSKSDPSSAAVSLSAAATAAAMETVNNNGNTSNQQALVTKILQQNQTHLSQSDTPTTSDSIKTMLKLKMAANAISKSFPQENSATKLNKSETGSASEIAMANVLTTLASQGRSVVITSGNVGQLSGVDKSSSQGVSGKTLAGHQVFVSPKPGGSDTSNLLTIVTDSNAANKASQQMFTVLKREPDSFTDSQSYLVDASKSSFVSTVSSGQQSVVRESSVDKSNSPVILNEDQRLTFAMSDDSQSNNQVLISYAADSGDSSAGSRMPILCPQFIEHNGKQYILHSSNVGISVVQSEGSSSPPTKYIAVQSTSSADSAHSPDMDEDSYSQIDDSIHNQTEIARTINVPVYTDPSTVGVAGSPCPICGDHISGFHYGIFTCESCKGFFKRTVQNKKSFLCHRQGECEITLENRKKCPACRFAKCLVMGMKLEAIRQDRTRGGRSSYAGVTPLDESKRKRPVRPIQRRPTPPSSSDSRLVTVLNYGEPSVKPFVPQILTDIMNLESLLNDDDVPGSISGEDLCLTDPNVFLNLLQLCEMKLYKIVRWARNLPYFANISTDDQILLLQNCWCELLALTMCWKSLQLTNEIVFFHGQTLDMEKAALLNITDMFMMLLAVVEHFRRLRLDQYECVALKVIVLICPDMKGLNDADKLSEHQTRVANALEMYTNSHYRSSPNKYGEMLLRLTELSRISGMLKEHLLSWMPPNTTSCGLLYELLKGENMKDLV